MSMSPSPLSSIVSLPNLFPMRGAWCVIEVAPRNHFFLPAVCRSACSVVPSSFFVVIPSACMLSGVLRFAVLCRGILPVRGHTHDCLFAHIYVICAAHGHASGDPKVGTYDVLTRRARTQGRDTHDVIAVALPRNCGTSRDTHTHTHTYTHAHEATWKKQNEHGTHTCPHGTQHARRNTASKRKRTRNAHVPTRDTARLTKHSV